MLHGYPMYAYIPARDMARARQFYEGKVGLKPKQELNGGVVYEFADHTGCSKIVKACHQLYRNRFGGAPKYHIWSPGTSRKLKRMMLANPDGDRMKIRAA